MKYIDIKIDCLEDIKVTSALNQVNTTESLSYISASAIRGAFISNYIKLFNIKDINVDKASKELFFNNKIEFFNGYIEYLGERTYPMPQGYYCDAIGIDQYHLGQLVDVKNSLINKIAETDKKFNPCEFISLDDYGTNIGTNVNKKFNLHIRTGKEKTMFRYEALEKGQSFRAIIKTTAEKEDFDKIIQVLELGEFYIGGSKGSGYGKTEITIMDDELERNPESIDRGENIIKEILIYTTSDCIFIDSYGNQTNKISENILEEKLGIKNVRLVSAATDEILVGGYNKKWNIRQPQYLATKKGSIFKYRFDGEIENEKLEKFEQEGYGLKIEEGYGRFIFIPKLDISIFKKADKEVKRENIRRIRYSDEEEEQLQYIVDSLGREKIDTMMKKIIVDNYSMNKNVKNNQIGKLIQLFSQAQKLEKLEGIKLIENYFDHLVNKKNNNEKELRINQKAINQLKDLKINGKSAINFINNQLKDINTDSFIENYSLETIFIDGKIPIISEQDAYVYKMIELEKIFRYILRTR